jgi:large subunit ribosomal protein L28
MIEKIKSNDILFAFLSIYANIISLMAKVCQITNKKSVLGGGYSNRTRATQFNPTGMKRRYPNLQKKRVFVPELNKTVVLTVSARGIKTIQKHGVFKTLKKASLI